MGEGKLPVEEYENFDAMQEAARKLVERWEREERDEPPSSPAEDEERAATDPEESG